MNSVLLTQYDGAILGPIAKILGMLLNVIFICIEKIGIPNIGLAIILFTIVIYLILLPLTVKQQKFSKLSAKMNPEIQAIQAKYKGKKDQDSMALMNQETQAVYKKYGVSPSGSCVNLIIQMPILFALYRVIYNVPAYVKSVKIIFTDLVDKLVNISDAAEFFNNTDNFKSVAQFSKQFTNELFVSGDKTYIGNTYIDVLNRASTTEWTGLSNKYPELADLVKTTYEKFEGFNNFFGLNIANSPSFYVSEFIHKNPGVTFGLVIGALLFPALAGLSQWLNTKLMPQQETNSGNDQANQMAATMKSMNIMMPLMSVVFCYTLPLGLGLYWIAGAVVRGIQQVCINKYIDKIDFDEIVKKNEEKFAKQIEKKGVKGEVINNNARMSTKSISDKRKVSSSDSKRDEAVKKSTEYYQKGVKAGSLTAKANMVRQYNEKNNK